VARGGLLPAGAPAYALGTKAAGTLNVEFYSDIEETLPDPVVLEPMLDTDAINGKKLLVVDCWWSTTSPTRDEPWPW